MNLTEQYHSKKIKVLITRNNGKIIEQEVDINTSGILVVTVHGDITNRDLEEVNNNIHNALSSTDHPGVLVISDRITIDYKKI